ncbi:MAG: type II toxin-antitoxin system RelE/ParE family toxin, partial [Candidatus Competibacteraceae bacterium]|nr:type II toxin-antitoxin system RelE/ParE family toxin [Candidatus Competibacteraceae bacterium]
MTWRVEISNTAAKQVQRLDKGTQGRIRQFLRMRIATDEDPRRIGHALQGPYQGLWRYRVGDYRLICRIQDDRLVVLVVTVGHR